MKKIHLQYKNNIETSEMKKLISFVDESIVSYVMHENFIEVECKSFVNDLELRNKFNRLVEKYHNVNAKEELFYENAKGKNYHDIEQAFDEEIIKTYGKGLIGFSGDGLGLFEFFSDSLKNLANKMGAEERMYPTLLDAQAYEKTGYLKTSPQHATFCCDVIEDMSCIEKLDEEFKKDNLKSILGAPQFALSPSACFHTYIEFENMQLAFPKMITFEQKVFRNEGRFNWEDLGRLRDYHIREIVFIGDNNYVDACRNSIIKKSIEFIEALDLDGRILSASDPFITPKMQRIKTLQLYKKSKYEARINTTKNSDIACASYNLHGVSFTKPFRITVQGSEPTVTGCVGFGIERWVLAFLCQYGTSKSKWPEEIKNYLKKKKTLTY